MSPTPTSLRLRLRGQATANARAKAEEELARLTGLIEEARRDTERLHRQLEQERERADDAVAAAAASDEERHQAADEVARLEGTWSLVALPSTPTTTTPHHHAASMLRGCRVPVPWAHVHSCTCASAVGTTQRSSVACASAR